MVTDTRENVSVVSKVIKHCLAEDQSQMITIKCNNNLMQSARTDIQHNLKSSYPPLQQKLGAGAPKCQHDNVRYNEFVL